MNTPTKQNDTQITTPGRKEREEKEGGIAKTVRGTSHEWNVFLAFKVRVTKVLRTAGQGDRAPHTPFMQTAAAASPDLVFGPESHDHFVP